MKHKINVVLEKRGVMAKCLVTGIRTTQLNTTLTESLLLVYLFFILSSPSYASAVVLIDSVKEDSMTYNNLKIASVLYGLELKRLSAAEVKGGLLNSYAANNTLGAIVVTSNAIVGLARSEVLESFGQQDINQHVPVLITEVTPDSHEDALSRWSDGAVLGCLSDKAVISNGVFKVADLKNVAQELSGMTIPRTSVSDDKTCYLDLAEGKQYDPILDIGSLEEERLFPLFIRTIVAKREVFFYARTRIETLSKEESWQYPRKYFMGIAPLLMFLRYSFGERAWHSVGDYANLTIDDSWLTEPYGNLSYKTLLKEMLEANFHTTIAFIPWNFDRNESDVTALFRDNQKRFSISIHGNNHDHEEFSDNKHLTMQEANIKQALARMDAFGRLTGLSYDKVMIFPHRISSARTLTLLKKYNFITTVNSKNIPSGEEPHGRSAHLLTGVLASFGNFPSLNRRPPILMQVDIARDLFLDNPVMFGTHQDFFSEGIKSFNKIALTVNQIQPNIEWRGLGYISQHLYLEKLRDDGNYDIQAFTSNFIIENRRQSKATYFIKKEESLSPQIKMLTLM